MSKVLLTGGSGFIAAHVLDQLLKKGHRVVTTVRSEGKAEQIRKAYANKAKDQLDVQIVPDIAQPDAFDQVVKIPGLEVVIHTASPFHFNITDPKKDLIDPAVIGTTGILKAIAKSAPSVKRVVVTSSFAAVFDAATATDPNTTYTENSWNSVTIDDIHQNPGVAYRASKTLAEKAAWAFVADKANGARFDLVTVNPPLVFGPIVHHLATLEATNTSNQRVRDLLQGKWKDAIPDTGVVHWVDVRDVATAHVKSALEIPDAGGRRLLCIADTFSNRDLVAIVKKNFPEYADRLPGDNVKGGEFPSPNELHGYDNSATTALLGIKWNPLEPTIVDTAKSLKALGA